MQANEVEKLLRAGVVKEAMVFPAEFGRGWLVGFGPGRKLEEAGYKPHLERSVRRGSGPKVYSGLDSAIAACNRMGFGRVEVVTDTASAA